MLELADYTILNQIAEGASTIIYRAIRIKDGRPVVLKTLREVYPSPAEVSKFTHEYNISKNLDIGNIIHPHGLEVVENRPILVLEDLGGESLRRILENGRLPLSVSLDIAINIADALDQIHRSGVIHKDLKPDNIIVNLESGLVKITDFSIAAYISEERSSTRPDRPEGTLAYMSPEQTGRLNRAVDYRTDFYSFGVMLYELLTGQRPFAGREALELVHAHIAIQPKPPHEVDETLPPILSDIVLKLMAKTADERYQSASAFLVDLTMCQRQWQEQKRIKAFPLAQQDVSDIFRIPFKIYGREQEQVQLLGAFHRTRIGRSELIFITGPAGIGRDALASEMRQPVAAQGGYFITGKFAPSGTGVPYSGIISAFKELVRQLLTENEASLRSWRQKIQKALGIEASIIIDVIPEIELIIGPHPDVDDLFPANSTRNRFHRVITNFVRVFCDSKHPLVMYLDHWQWADAASLKWLQLVLTDETITSLLIIAAYRAEASEASTVLVDAVQQMEEQGAHIGRMELHPLALRSINQIIADTLHRPSADVQEMAELVFRKTRGIPFFVHEFLQAAYHKQAVFFDYQARRWRWDLEKLSQLESTDSVVDLLVDQLRRLPLPTVNILKIAACVGNEFAMPLLAAVSKQPLDVAEYLLSPAVEQGFVELVDETQGVYRFVYSRIRQAVYGLLPLDEKTTLHLQIGQLILNMTDSEELEELIFNVVSQFNHAA
ncbi:MAG: AAA family ATPase, partial [Anaerolineales bacterium]|nr:AAA family ATPase [Anaerolineales bacterium]